MINRRDLNLYKLCVFILRNKFTHLVSSISFNSSDSLSGGLSINCFRRYYNNGI